MQPQGTLNFQVYIYRPDVLLPTVKHTSHASVLRVLFGALSNQHSRSSHLPSTLLGTWGALDSSCTGMAAGAISQLHECIHLLLCRQGQALRQVLVLFLEGVQLIAAAG